MTAHWLRSLTCRVTGHRPMVFGHGMSLADLLSLGMRCARCGKYRDPHDTRWRARP